VKCFDVAGLAASQGGEYVLGDKDLHTQACYLVYGLMEAGEGSRLIKPGEGYEEILCAVNGSLIMHTGRGDVTLSQGNAIHLRGDESFFISNPNDTSVIYVMAGGRSI